jgi:hypothetical protein
MALTPEEKKALLESLFAMPVAHKAKPKKEKPSIPKPSGISKIASAFRPSTIARYLPGFTPATRIITIVKQECTSCGGQTEFSRTAVIRHTKAARAVELDAVMYEQLPTTIREEWEFTNHCPSCLRLDQNLEPALKVFTNPQLELFK